MEKPQSQFVHLSMAFLNAMEEIGQLGFEKHGANSFYAMTEKKRVIQRHESAVIMQHAREHIWEYENAIPHDHFETQIHHLAAAAFNCMVEAQFAGLAVDEAPKISETQEPAPLPKGEVFLLTRKEDEDSRYTLTVQRAGWKTDLKVEADTPEEAVMQMRKLLDLVKIIAPNLEPNSNLNLGAVHNAGSNPAGSSPA